jgi:hypothetical protein
LPHILQRYSFEDGLERLGFEAVAIIIIFHIYAHLINSLGNSGFAKRLKSIKMTLHIDIKSNYHFEIWEHCAAPNIGIISKGDAQDQIIAAKALITVAISHSDISFPWSRRRKNNHKQK